ncbi:MAG: biotin transporter BioY [Planctomycetota bacterium]|jgi:biotin transport system substrate-specific component
MSANVTVAGLLRPCEKKLAALYDVAVVVGGSLLIALCAQLAIGWPIPVSGQTFAVLMIGALLGARRASVSVLTYIMAGAAGLPVFAHGRSGFMVLSGPTGGYLFGFVFAVYVVGLLAERGWDRRTGTTILAMIFGNLVIYAFGLLWLYCLVCMGKLPVSANKILTVGLYPFIPGDLLKVALAAILLPSGWKLLGSIGLPAKEHKPR